jgi:hypothetical protein
MSLTIISDPEVEYQAAPLAESVYSSVNRPIKFGIERGSDFSFSGIVANSSTTATVTATGFGAQWYNTVTPGIDFEIEITGSDIPDGTYTVTSDILIGSNSFIIDITGMGLFPGSYTAGDLKIVRLNYRVKTRISVAGSVVGTAVNKLDSNYQTTTDISAFLKSSLSYDENFNFTDNNAKDLTVSNLYTVEFSENWSGHDGTYDAEGTGNFYFTNSVRQLGDSYNGNMADYTIYSVDIGIKPKFLSDFEKPSWFEGHPFSLDFIFGEDFNTGIYNITRHDESFDINSTSILEVSTTLDKTQNDYINRMTIYESYDPTAQYVEVWLERLALG